MCHITASHMAISWTKTVTQNRGKTGQARATPAGRRGGFSVERLLELCRCVKTVIVQGRQVTEISQPEILKVLSMRCRSGDRKLSSDPHHCGSFFFFQIIIWAHFLTTETHILGRTGSSPSFFHQPLQTRVFPSSGSVTSRLWLNWSWAQDIRALSINSTNRRTPVVPSDLGQIQFILSSLLWFSWWEEKAKVCYVQVCLFWPLEQSQKELFQQNSLCP